MQLGLLPHLLYLPIWIQEAPYAIHLKPWSKHWLLKKRTQHALVHGTMEERENHQVYLTIVKPPGITKIPPFICCISMKNFLLICYYANDTCSFVSFYWQQNF
jgi:hypothetical protein